MFPSARRRLVAAIAAALVAATPLSISVGPNQVARAGSDSPPAPVEFGADTIGVFAGGEEIDHVAIIWDEIIDPNSIPDPDDFDVTINGVVLPQGPSRVTLVYSGLASEESLAGIDGASFMKIELPTTWNTTDDEVLLTYRHGADPVRDRALNQAEPFTDQEVTPFDFGDFFAIAAGVDSHHADDRILLVLSLPIDPATIPDAGDFVVTDETGEIEVRSVTPLFENTGLGILDLELAIPMTDPTSAVALDYAPVPVDERIRSARDGTELDPFFDEPVILMLASDSATGTGSASTATADGPTPADPVATTVTSPTGGEVTIQEGSVTETSTAGYEFFGQQIEITAPDALSAEEPLVIRFDIDASLVPAGEDEMTVQLFRNGDLIPECTDPAIAAPPTCIAERTALADGDISITALTIEASTWNMGVAPPFDFGGFQPPVNSDVPNLASAGSAIPVRFSLDGDRGLEIFAAGSPSVRLLSCSTLADGEEVEETITAGESSLRYNASTDTYTYVWKTSRAWGDSCRRLVLDFVDGSQASAVFDFRP